jgi:hypothetical protein
LKIVSSNTELRGVENAQKALLTDDLLLFKKDDTDMIGFNSQKALYMNRLLVISGVLSIFVWPAKAEPADYYVDKSSSSNPANCLNGPNNLYKDINEAAQCAEAGDTVRIRSGVYYETVTPKYSGSSGSYITFMPDTVNGVMADVTISGVEEIAPSSWSHFNNQSNVPIYVADISTSLFPGVIDAPHYQGAAPIENNYLFASKTPDNTSLFAPQVFYKGRMMIEARWPNLKNLDFMQPSRAKAASTSVPTANNSGNYTLYDSNLNGQTGLDSSGSPTSVNWSSGGMIHIWLGQEIGVNTAKVLTNPSNEGKLTFDVNWGAEADNTPFAIAGRPYFLTGKKEALDAPGEWFYEESTRKLYFMLPDGSNPTNSNFKVGFKTRNYAFDLKGKQYVKIQNIKINASTIRIENEDLTYEKCSWILPLNGHHVLDGLEILYPSHFNIINYKYGTNVIGLADPRGIYVYTENTGLIIRSNHNTVKNNHIAYSAGNGIALKGQNNLLVNNFIHDVNYVGNSGAGIFVRDSYNKILSNTIARSGGSGIEGLFQSTFTFDPTKNPDDPTNNPDCNDPLYFQKQDYSRRLSLAHLDIGHNNISNFRMLGQDGGGFYVSGIRGCFTVGGIPDLNSMSKIHHNWIHDIRNVADLLTGHAYSGAGIYLDQGNDDSRQNSSNYWNVHHNVLWNNSGDGLRINVGHKNVSDTFDGRSKGNIIENNTFGLGQRKSIGISKNLVAEGLRVTDYSDNDKNKINKNIFLSRQEAIEIPTQNIYHGPSSTPEVGLEWLGFLEFGVKQNAYKPPKTPNPFQICDITNIGSSCWANPITLPTDDILDMPSFIDRSQHDYRLSSATSPIAGQGAYDPGSGDNQGWTDHPDTDVVERWVPGAHRKATSVIQAESFDSRSNGGAYVLPPLVSGEPGGIGGMNPGDWVRYNNIDFGSSPSSLYFYVKYAVPVGHEGKKIEIKLDSLSNTTIGTLTLSATGGTSTYTTSSILLTNPTGVHDVYLVFQPATSGSNVGPISHIDAFKFSGSSSDTLP